MSGARELKPPVNPPPPSPPMPADHYRCHPGCAHDAALRPGFEAGLIREMGEEIGHLRAALEILEHPQASGTLFPGLREHLAALDADGFDTFLAAVGRPDLRVAR